MAAIEVSRTLVKSPPELWMKLRGERLGQVAGARDVRVAEPERRLTWEGTDNRGTALLEPTAWGTKVTLTVEVEGTVARAALWRRRTAARRSAERRARLERQLSDLLDDLGAAHRKPFTNV